jgi:cytochrome c oxidase subunit 1
MPWLALAGLLVFGAAGITAGYMGVPRRVMDVSYQQQAPALWHSLMLAVALGGSVMAAALLVFAGGVAASLLPKRQPGVSVSEVVVAWGGTAVKAGSKAWVGPVSILAIVAAMYAFSAVGFELMQSLPISASGGGGH